MSDSSEDEDLTKFKDAVDTTFVKLINESRGCIGKEPDFPGNKKSERHLETSSHYNDVRVPDEMQRRIGAKISAIIEKNVEFVTLDNTIRKRKIKGGIKLFTDSESFMSCDEVKDTFTEAHNMNARKLKCRRRHVDCDTDVSGADKVSLVVVSGEHILSKEDTKFWKSRKKEKIYKYKSNAKTKELTAVE